MNFQENPQSLLTFRVGPVLCCAPSLPVDSIIRPPRLTHPPGSDRAQPGIFRHGSHIVKVIDLRQRFGVEAEEQTQPGNLIICHFEKDYFAFWVDQIMDVFDFPTEGWGALPAAIPRRVFSRTLLLNKKIHLYAEFINFTKLHDLGYLKHYIQQLKQKEIESTGNTGAQGKKQQARPSLEAKNNETITSSHNSDSLTSKVATVSTASHIDNPIKTHSSLVQDDRGQKIKPRVNTDQTKTTTATRPVASAGNETTTGIPTPVKSTQAKASTFIPSERHFPKKPEAFTKPVATTKPAFISKSDPALNQSSEQHHSAIPQASAPTIQNVEAKKVSASTQYIQTEKLTKTTNTSTHKDEGTSSSLLAVIFLLILLALIGAGIYLLLIPEKQTQPATAFTTEPLNETNLQPETTGENFFNTTTNKTTKEKIVAPVKETPSPVDSRYQTETGAPAYQAEISHRENEITITIHEPDAREETETGTSAEIKTVPKETEKILTVDSSNETLPENTPVTPLKQGELAKVVNTEKPVREIIHIVIKGDTLWAIAKKYVHNPFLYPELARLSNIKNPHRIYPGDRVRIRFVKKQK